MHKLRIKKKGRGWRKNEQNTKVGIKALRETQRRGGIWKFGQGDGEKRDEGRGLEAKRKGVKH